MIFSFDVGMSVFKPSGKDRLVPWHSTEEGGMERCRSKQREWRGRTERLLASLVPPPLRGGGGETGQHVFQPENDFVS